MPEPQWTICIAPDSSEVDFGDGTYVVTAPDWDSALRLVAEDLLPYVNENLAQVPATWDEVFGLDGSDPYFTVEFSFHGAPDPVRHDWDNNHRGEWVDRRTFLPANTKDASA